MKAESSCGLVDYGHFGHFGHFEGKGVGIRVGLGTLLGFFVFWLFGSLIAVSADWLVACLVHLRLIS